MATKPPTRKPSFVDTTYFVHLGKSLLAVPLEHRLASSSPWKPRKGSSRRGGLYGQFLRMAYLKGCSTMAKWAIYKYDYHSYTYDYHS